MMKLLSYWLSEHPSIVGFRWSPAASWGSTWFFLVSSISIYVSAALFLELILSLLNRRRPIPLGPIPAVQSLAMSAASSTIFLGLLLSSFAEIRDTRWFWRRLNTTPMQWLLCFPIGTRPTGRVFFWSYAFYLSRFLHLIQTFFSVLRRRCHRRRLFCRLFGGSSELCAAFLWLEFSQSFQVIAILSSTMSQAVVSGYRFWVAVAGGGAGENGIRPVAAACRGAVLGCHVACHAGVVVLHLRKGGCNGIGAWMFNSVVNAAALILFLGGGGSAAAAAPVEKGGNFVEDDSSKSLRCRESTEAAPQPVAAASKEE